MPLSSGPVPYVVLLPVKPPGRGKSRLGDLPRDELATAFAMDTATACLAAPSVQQVLVVTDDARFAGALSAVGCAAILLVGAWQRKRHRDGLMRAAARDPRSLDANTWVHQI